MSHLGRRQCFRPIVKTLNRYPPRVVPNYLIAHKNRSRVMPDQISGVQITNHPDTHTYDIQMAPTASRACR